MQEQGIRIAPLRYTIRISKHSISRWATPLPLEVQSYRERTNAAPSAPSLIPRQRSLGRPRAPLLLERPRLGWSRVDAPAFGGRAFVDLRLRPSAGGWSLRSALHAFGFVEVRQLCASWRHKVASPCWSPSPAGSGGGDQHALRVLIAPTRMTLMFWVDFAVRTGVKSTRNHSGHLRLSFWVDFAVRTGVKSTRNLGLTPEEPIAQPPFSPPSMRPLLYPPPESRRCNKKGRPVGALSK